MKSAPHSGAGRSTGEPRGLVLDTKVSEDVANEVVDVRADVATVNEIVNIATYAAVQAPLDGGAPPSSPIPETLFTDLRPSRNPYADDEIA